MGLAAAHDDGVLLKNLVPLNALSDEQLGPLLSRISVERAKKGAFLFKAGDTEEQNIYILSGNVAFISDDKEVDAVRSGSETARYPLAHNFPRQLSAQAKTAVAFVRIDSHMLSDLLLRSQSEDTDIAETESESSDWMSQLLQSPIFQQIPPANMQQVMMRMETVNVSAGDVIIRQNDEGDYYYMVSRGTCIVTRQPDKNSTPVKLAQLGPGNSFGEEALVSQMPRSGTVTMQTDGTLVRLGKEDFEKLVCNPLSRPVNYKQALELIEDGAHWLDVRMPEEYEKHHLENAINLPSFSLRFQTFNLNPDLDYIVYAKKASFAAATTFLLLERGFSVYYLDEELAKVIKKSSVTNLETPPVESNEATVPEVDQESANEEYEQRLKQEQIKLQRLEQLFLKTKQGLTAAVEEKGKASEQLTTLKAELKQAQRQLATYDEVTDERDQALANIEALQTAKSAMEESRLLQEGELKEQITALQFERDEAGEANETQQSEHAATQEAITTLKQQLEEEQQVWQKERETLESQCSTLTNQIEQLQQTQTEVENSSAQLTQEITSLQQQLGESKEVSNELEKERTRLQQAQAQIETLTASSNAQTADLDEQLSIQQQRITALDEELDALRLVLQQEQSNHEEKEREQKHQLETLQQQLESERANLKELEQGQQSLLSDKQQQQEQLSALQQQLTELENAGADIDRQKSQQQEQIVQLTDELTAFKEEQNTSQAQLKSDLEEAHLLSGELTQKRETLEAEVDKQNQQINQLEQQIEQSATTKGAFEQESAEQQQRITSLNEEINRLTEQSEQQEIAHQNALAGSSALFDNTKNELLKKNQRLTEMETKVAELERELDNLNKAEADLDGEKSALKRQILTLGNELKTSNEKLNTEITTRSEDQAGHQQQIKKLTAQLSDLNSSGANFEEEKHELHEEIIELRSKVEQANDQLAAETATHGTLQSEHQLQIEQLTGQLSDLKTNSSNLGEEKGKLQEEVIQLRNNLEQTNDKLTTEITTHSSDQADFQQQVEALQRELAELKTSDTDQEEERATQQAKSETLTAELTQLQDQLNSEKSARLDEQTTHQEQLKHLHNELQLEQDSTATLEQFHESFEAEKSKQDQQIKTLQQQLNNTSSNEAEQTKERDEQQQNITLLTEKQAAQLKQIEALKKELEEAADEQDASLLAFQETIDELVEKKDDFKAEAKQFKQQLEQQEEASLKLEKSEKALAAVQQRVTGLEASEQLSLASVQSELKQSHSEIASISAEKDAALQKAETAQSEVQQLRTVMEQYVDQIKSAQAGNDKSEELEALQSELEMVRLQASHDLKKLQSKLDIASSLSTEERNPGQVALEQQQRQDLDRSQKTLQEKEHLLEEAAANMRTMEDSLEERDTHTDRLQVEVERLQQLLDTMLQQQGGGAVSSELIEGDAASEQDSSMLSRMFKSK